MGRSNNSLENRREQAAKFSAASAKRTPVEQLKRLDDKLGAGVGAVRERLRLTAMIEAGWKGTQMGDLPVNWRAGKRNLKKTESDTDMPVAAANADAPKAKQRRKKQRQNKSQSDA